MFNAEEFVKQNFQMLCNMENALKNKIQVVAPYVPKESGFSQARFIGRYLGFYHATWNDVRTPRMVEEKYGSGNDDVRIVMTSFTEEEQIAVDKLLEKIETANQKGIFEESLRLGLWEGIAILVHKEDLSLLYSENDIDLNKGVPGCEISSYENARLTSMVIHGYLNWNKSVGDIVEILRKEGVNEVLANKIVYGALPTIKSIGPQSTIKTKPLLILGFTFIVSGLCSFLFSTISDFSNYALLFTLLGFGTFCILLAMKAIREKKKWFEKIGKEIEEGDLCTSWHDTSQTNISGQSLMKEPPVPVDLK